MKLSDLQLKFLSELYNIRFVQFEHSLNYGDWTTENKYSQNDVDNCFHELRENGLIKSTSIGRTAALTSDGVLLVEDEKLFDENVIRIQKQFRSNFLVALADIRDISGPRGMADWESVTRKIGSSNQIFAANYEILKDGRYIESKSRRSFQITAFGYEIVEKYRESVKYEAEFEQFRHASAKDMDGLDEVFMSLIKSKCITDGWQCDMVDLELDGSETLIFHRDLNFFLSKCVCQKEKELSRDTIRTLRQQVASRPGTYGCVFSLSPISVDAFSEAQMHLETACIIIFGENDLVDLFRDGNLTEAVNVKMVNARIRRLVQAQ